MKSKTKKILSGVCLGAIMATTPLFAGCTSDITFNQGDLDKALVNINEYLETQNNYNSDFAKNCLMNYLIDGANSTSNTTNFSVTYSYKEKTKQQGNTTVSEVQYNNTVRFQEVEFNQETKKYKSTTYENDKSYSVSENLDTINYISQFTSSVQFYKLVLDMCNGDCSMFTMDTLEDGSEVFKTYKIENYTNEKGPNSVISCFTIKFKEQKLVNLQITEIDEFLPGNIINSYQIENYDIEYNIPDIQINKSQYTKA